MPATWHSLGDAPLFNLLSASGQYPTGWVYMTTTLARKGTNFTARLFVDSGAGFIAQTPIIVPATRRGSVKHVFKLPVRVRGLRWSPMQSEGLVVQEPIIIAAIGQIERIIRMAVWVWLDLQKFKKTNQARQHGLSVARLIFDLQGAYAASAKLRINFAPPSYESFSQKYVALSLADQIAIRAHIADLYHKPLISLIMLTQNTPESLLVAAIESVRNQIYPYWSLCIADNDATEPHVRQIISRYQQRDSRIRVANNQRIGQLSVAANRALQLVTGPYVACMAADAALAAQALYHVAVASNEQPLAELFYTDEDKINTQGKHLDPHFKCDWNPDLFLSHNYLAHLCVYKTATVNRIGGFRAGFEDDLHYDLTLRFVKQIAARHICHIPFVLYHARSYPESTAPMPEINNQNSGIKALGDYFTDQPGVLITQGPFAASYRVQYPLPEPLPKVSLLIPTRNGYEVLHQCIDSIRAKTSYPNWEIIILNNQTDDPTTLSYFEQIKLDNRIRVLDYDQPFNYSAINNYGAQSASGELLGLLNNDVEVINPDWLTEMVSHAIRPDIGAVGAKLFYTDGYVQHAGVVVGLGGLAGHVHRLFPRDHPGYAGRAVLTQNFSAITAACLIVRRELFIAIGGLDEQHLTIAYNDVDLCLKISAAGYRNLWTPYAQLYHHESYSRGDDQATPEKRNRFNKEKDFMWRRWQTDITPDPYYSPNLTTDNETFAITHKPRVTQPWTNYMPKQHW